MESKIKQKLITKDKEYSYGLSILAKLYAKNLFTDSEYNQIKEILKQHMSIDLNDKKAT